MAEIRKHQPDEADGLGKLVRDALGEKIRPLQPGGGKQTDEQTTSSEPTHDEPTRGEPSASSLPSWPSDGPAFSF